MFHVAAADVAFAAQLVVAAAPSAAVAAIVARLAISLFAGPADVGSRFHAHCWEPRTWFRCHPPLPMELLL